MNPPYQDCVNCPWYINANREVLKLRKLGGVENIHFSCEPRNHNHALINAWAETQNEIHCFVIKATLSCLHRENHAKGLAFSLSTKA